MPFKQPVDVPTRIEMQNVVAGTSVSSIGGGFPKGSGDASVGIEGDSSGVFSISQLETQALVHDPDAPRGTGGVWETVLVVNGSGPISIGEGEVLVVTVGFACPAAPTHDTYSATATVILAGSSPPILQNSCQRFCLGGESEHHQCCDATDLRWAD